MSRIAKNPITIPEKIEKLDNFRVPQETIDEDLNFVANSVFCSEPLNDEGECMNPQLSLRTESLRLSIDGKQNNSILTDKISQMDYEPHCVLTKDYSRTDDNHDDCASDNEKLWIDINSFNYLLTGIEFYQGF